MKKILEKRENIFRNIIKRKTLSPLKSSPVRVTGNKVIFKGGLRLLVCKAGIEDVPSATSLSTVFKHASWQRTNCTCPHNYDRNGIVHPDMFQ